MNTEFETLTNKYLAEHFSLHPLSASQCGADGHDDEMPDLSASGITRTVDHEDTWLARFDAVSDAGLDADEQIDRDLIRATLRGARVMRDWQEWKRNPATYLDPGLEGVFTLFLHRIHPEDVIARAAEARLRAVPELLEQGKRNLDAEIASPIFVERAIGTCDAAVAYVRTLLPAEAADDANRARLAAAGEIAATAYAAFGTYLRELLPKARGQYAIGEQRYSAVLKEREMLGYGCGGSPRARRRRVCRIG